jgi:hypothetical protein
MMWRRIKAWWRSRSTVVVTFPEGCGQWIVAIDASPEGVLRVSIGDRVVEVRSRWWDTRASLARKVRVGIANELAIIGKAGEE